LGGEDNASIPQPLELHAIGNDYVFITYIKICNYANISNGIPNHIVMETHNQSWTQPLDHEHVVFKCILWFEHGHVGLLYESQSLL